MNLVRTVDATTEPVTLAEVKLFSRIDITDDDALLTALIKSARRQAENYCRRAFIEQTWRYSLDAINAPRSASDISANILDEVRGRVISDTIELPMPNLLSVTSVTSYDKTNAATVFSTSNYTVDTNNTPGRIYLNDGSVWPSDLRVNDAIVIVYKAGFGATAASVPEEIKTAIKLIVGVLYENREDTTLDGNFSNNLPFGARSILTSYRLMRV